MGLKKEGYATVWDVKEIGPTLTSVRVSTQKKNRDGEYEQDFSGFLTFKGKNLASRAATLRVKDRIKILEFEVQSSYNKEKGQTYTNFVCWDFDVVGGSNSDSGKFTSQKANSIDEGFGSDGDDDCPF